jgi:hypothetical protein
MLRDESKTNPETKTVILSETADCFLRAAVQACRAAKSKDRSSTQTPKGFACNRRVPHSRFVRVGAFPRFLSDLCALYVKTSRFVFTNSKTSNF